jgi:glutamate:GABA antiporter
MKNIKDIKNIKKPTMSVLTLVMINVIAIDSLRGIPMGAHYGLSLIVYYVIAGLFFFLPSALISAELATAWPETGGIYVWVREAFGKRFGFLVIFIQWVYNICWYPTVLSFLAATLAYLVNPNLANNVWYVLAVVFATYWLLTAITLLGMHVSGRVSTVTAIVGTLLPMPFVTVLGIIWLMMGKPIQMPLNMAALIPDISKPNNLVLLTAILYTLVGMEMSATHAQEVKDPQKNYPKALLYSSVIIFLSLVLSSLAVALVLPTSQLDILTGLLDAFHAFFKNFGLEWLMPFMGIFVIIGIIGGVGAWMIGPTRGMLIAAQDGCVPPFLRKINKKNMPIALLLVQGMIFSIICLVFLVMPSINSSFWILSDLTSQLALLSYIFMFAAAIYLRYKQPKIKRTYKVPFGNFGMWTIGTAGILSCVITISLGFLPPAQINIGSFAFYETFLITGFIGFCAIPLIIYQFRRRQ